MSTKKLGFYILITRGVPAMKRHKRMWDGTYSQQVDKSQVKFVINTRDEDFKATAIEWLDSEGIPWVSTKSNGGPSKGKNSVLSEFLKSDDDYMVMIDGDDFLTPHGIYTYKAIANPAQHESETNAPDDWVTPTTPDVVVIENQYGIIPNEGYSWHLRMEDSKRSASKWALDPYNQEHIAGLGYRCFLRPKAWWDRCLAGNWIEKGSPYLRMLSDAHAELTKYEHDYVNGCESHTRITFYSRKAVEYAKFPEDLLVGEDVMNYMELKDAAYKGDIVMKSMNDLYPTYVYDQRIGGIVALANDKNHGRGWLDWMTVFINYFKRYEAAGKLHHIDDYLIPWIDLPYYPPEYAPDTCNLVQYPSSGNEWKGQENLTNFNQR